jgi:NAD(P)-dependent dehydrogenase (short-subunit alcohol dehydrogenase family)
MVALADTDEYMLAAAVEQVSEKNAKAIAVHTDMLDFAAARELAQRSAAELGAPWLVCNNPGVSVDVNLWGVVNGVQAFAPGMFERGGGHIVNIVAAELFGMPGAAPYVAAMHAIVSLSEGLYRELDSMGSRVGVSLVCPAPVRTQIVAPENQKADPSMMRDVPLKALSPEEIAEEVFTAVATRRFRLWPNAHVDFRTARRCSRKA